jgi:predicted nucleotidyltransferase
VARKIPKRVQTILKEVREELKKIYHDRFKEMILFGSYARGDAADDSDIDIVLLLENVKDISTERDRYLPVTGQISLKYDTVVSVVPFDVQDFHQKRTPLILNVNKEGVRI